MRSAPELSRRDAPILRDLRVSVVKLLLALAVVLLALAIAPANAAMSFPPLTGRVVDDANVLSDDTKAQLAQMLAQEERQTTNQIVVVTLKSLEGYPIEDYGYQLGRHWGIGQKKKDNGALIIVAPNEHKTRIEVGYGLEGQLTDAQTKIVIERYMVPAFRRGDFDGGVLAGTNAVLQLLGGVTLSPPQHSDESRDRSSGGIPWAVIVFILVWLVFGRFLWPLFFLGALTGRRGGWGGSSGGGFGGGFGGGGFGGGGFSGGGGSFGGGGASGSW